MIKKETNYQLREFQGEYIEFNMALQLCICYYEEVYTDFKSSITLTIVWKTVVLHTHTHKISTCPIIKSTNIEFHTDILNPAHKNDIITDIKILKFKDSTNANMPLLT